MWLCVVKSEKYKKSEAHAPLYQIYDPSTSLNRIIEKLTNIQEASD